MEAEEELLTRFAKREERWNKGGKILRRSVSDGSPLVPVLISKIRAKLPRPKQNKAPTLYFLALKLIRRGRNILETKFPLTSFSAEICREDALTCFASSIF